MSLRGWHGKVGSTVAALRKKKHISQEELSFVSAVDRTYMSRIEQGKANPTLRVLQRIARALRVSIVDLLEGNM